MLQRSSRPLARRPVAECAAMTAGAPAFVPAILAAAAETRKLLTLVLINDGKRVLLGEKKRGFGAGYYNGFGGKVEPGETVRDAAQRELQEEACITAEDLEEAGVLTFVFDDQPSPWEVHVYGARRYTGEPTETDEMRPQWFEHDRVPFAEMWADDVHWYPLFLAGVKFSGTFAFANTTQLVWHELSTVGESAAAARTGTAAAAVAVAAGAPPAGPASSAG